MKYGLIGEKLSHSFSKEIHEALTDYDYEIRELTPDEVAPFLAAREFEGINVTIPYKEKVTKVTDMRSGKELEFKLVEGGIEVTNHSTAVGHMGDIADCYILEK